MLNIILFYLAIAFVLFVPGYALLCAIFGKNKALGSLERFIISFGLSVTILDFILFALNKSGILISKTSIISSLIIFLIICAGIYGFRFARKKEVFEEEKLFNFGKKQFYLLLLFIFLAVFIKTAYLANSTLPSSTDMGHHMYWAKLLGETGTLPTYDGMPDFIIGEHTVFGALNVLTGADFFSAFPVVILFLVNLMSILAVFILVLRIFKNKNIAILSILFLGVLFAVSSPQAKYVSGGVVGNIFGNFFLPLVFYFYFRAFEFLVDKNNKPEKAKIFLALAIFLSFGMFYTHHLTSFIFLFSFIGLVVIFLAVNFQDLGEILKKVWRVVFSWEVLITLAFCLVFFFLVFTPTYISGNAVDTAVGSPVKATRTGLSLDNVRSTVGDARLALGAIGLILLILFYQKRNFGFAVVGAWSVMIFLMSTKPNWMLVDIPSNRIGNYLTFPIAILSAFGFVYVFTRLKTSNLLKISFAILVTFVFSSGLYDSALSFKAETNAKELTETFSASQYLDNVTNDKDKILKDHNYLNGDSWIKLFFMRGYRYPDSRGYFKRYDDPLNPREMCTLYMISEPGSEKGKNCFAEVGTNFLMVNPNFDRGQFLKLDNFNQIYSNADVAVFYLPR